MVQSARTSPDRLSLRAREARPWSGDDVPIVLMAGTFVSYRREDAAGYAGRLRESLERRLGSARVFRDVDTLRPGEDFVASIDARLAECRVMLVVIGREWLDARTADGRRRLDDPHDFVRLEVAAALTRPNVLIVPVLVEGMTMPPAEALPERIRPLARRHAVSVRDETWNADIDRLVDLIDEAEATWQPMSGVRRRLSPVAMASAVLVALAVAVMVWRGGRGTSTNPTEAAPADQATAPSLPGAPGLPSRTLTAGASEPADPASAPAAAYTIALPRLAEAGFEDVVYTVVSGNVVTPADGRELRLRIRVMNGESRDLNFWDDSFRLAADGQLLAPSSGLNEVVPGNSLRYGLVVFRLPVMPPRAVLHINHRGASAAVPLDLSATGRPPVDEQAVVTDSLSQAVGWRPSLPAGSLLETPDFTVSLERATVRRFVNTARLTLVLRVVHNGRRARSAGDLQLRVALADDLLAPWRAPQDIIEPATTRILDVSFDLPPGAGDAVLKMSLGDHAAEHPLSVREPS